MLFLVAATLPAIAQRDNEDDERRGFDKNRLFAGGSINVGFGAGSFAVGGNPQIGYSLTQWLDAGITTNIIYSSQRYNWYGSELRQRSWTYGGGPFVKIFPISMIHLQAQYEYNRISGNVEQISTGFRETFGVGAPSLLVGAGYGQRVVGQSSFFTTILFDVTKNEHSPYIMVEGQRRISQPIIRAGFTVYFGRRGR